jgi:hypothetical protein
MIHWRRVVLESPSAAVLCTSSAAHRAWFEDETHVLGLAQWNRYAAQTDRRQNRQHSGQWGVDELLTGIDVSRLHHVQPLGADESDD